MKAKVIVLTSPFVGSNRQLKALGEEIYPNHTVEERRITLRQRSSLWLLMIRLVIHLKKSCRKDSIRRYLNRFFLSGDTALSGVKAIIAKRPTFEHTMALLAAGEKIETVYVGSQKKYKTPFDLIVSTPSTPTNHADIQLEYLPTSIRKPDSNVFNKIDQTESWILLIGGKIEGTKSSFSEWKTLIDKIVSFSVAQGPILILATSPRTEKKVTEYIISLSQNNQPGNVEPNIFGSINAESLSHALARSSIAFVTEDSAAMVADAVNVGLPVISIRFDKDTSNNLSTPQAKFLEKKKRLLRATVVDLDKSMILEFIQNHFEPVSETWDISLRKQLKFFRESTADNKQ